MIQVSAEFGAGRTSIVSEGHEGHVEGGRVCAAITAILNAAYLGIEDVARQYPHLVSVTLKENP